MSEVDKIRKLVREMDDAQAAADDAKNQITQVIIDAGHTDLLTVNWRRVRQWIRHM